ncbi:hypothetical protein FAI41_04115 [Acetobacteraceae bacterium]|nr:hypothetical protein FAI41_04115 [Acetobacteraceae bacterium]
MRFFLKCLPILAFPLAVALPAKAQMVAILGHFPGVENVDYVSNVQAWVSARSDQKQGAASDACSLIYFEIPKSMADMGAPVSFVGRKNNRFEIRALNTEWPILPDQTGWLSLKINGHIYRFKMSSDEGGVISGGLSGTELKEVFNALSLVGESPYSRMILTYAENKSAHDSRYDGTSNGAINNMDTDPRSRAEAAKQRRLNREANKPIVRSFSVPVRGIAKTIDSFNACLKELD